MRAKALIFKGDRAGLVPVIDRRKALGIAVFALIGGVVLGAATALAWVSWRDAGERRQMRATVALADRYAKDLASALQARAEQDFAGVAASSPVKEGGGEDGRPASASDVASAPAAQQGAAPATPASNLRSAEQQVAQDDSSAQALAKPLKPTVRTTMAAASVQELGNDFVRFRGGSVFRVGQKLPSGAQLLQVDPQAGKIVTSQRTLVLLDYSRNKPADVASASAAAASGSGAPASGPPVEQSAQRAASVSKEPAASSPPPSLPASQAAQPVASAVPVVTVTPAQANIVAIDATGVRFLSGRSVAVGEMFPSGERLLHVVPSEGKIVTDRRVIYVVEPGVQR